MIPKKLIPLLLLSIACQSPPSVSGDLREPPSPLQDGLTCEWNDSRTFQLCTKDRDTQTFPNPMVFEIYDKAGNLVLEKRLRSGYVKWVGDTDVEYFQTPGMMPEGVDRNDLVQVYQIRTKETVSKKEYLAQKEQ